MDMLFGFLYKPVFNMQGKGKYFTTSYAMKKASEEVVVFGNSHAAEHFNALRMQDSLKTSVFNFGNQGQSVLYYYFLLESLLLHHKPKLVILNLDYYELQYSKGDYDNLSIFLPHKNQNSYIDSSISMLNTSDKYKANSNLYRYNSMIGLVFLNLLNKSYGKSLESQGFDPMSGNICTTKLNSFDETKVSNKAVDKSLHF